MGRPIRLRAGIVVDGPVVLNALGVVTFPNNPMLGTFIVKDGVVWIYQMVDGVAGWQPYTGKSRAFVYSTAIPSLTWTVVHSLGSMDLWFQVKDIEGNVVGCSVLSENYNTSVVSFAEPTAGSIILVSPDTLTVVNGANGAEIASGGDSFIDALIFG